MYKFSGSSSAHETDSKAIECPTCNRPFVSTSIVNDYMHKKNKYTKSYKCEVCLKFFFTKSSLTMHGRKAVRVRHLRQKVRHQKRPAELQGDPQRGEEVQVRGLSQGLQNEERPGQAHGVPWQPEALVREVQQKVLHFKRTEVARKKK